MDSNEWSRIRQGIFGGESGGDYNALFNYQNRPGGRFADTKLTDMTVNQALEFSSPSGPYADYVRGQVGRVATPMGAYQIVGSTLRDASKGLGLTGDEKMTTGLQEKLGQWIYQKQGTGAWEGYKHVTDAQAVGADAMAALGRQSNTGGQRMAMQPTQRQGILGALGIQKQDRNAQGDTALPFYQRDDFKDTMGKLAVGFNSLTLRPDQNLAANVRANRQERQTNQRASQSMEWLSRQPNSEAYIEMLRAGAPVGQVLQAYQKDVAGGADGVQSSTALPDQSGVVMTMRDGSIVVKTIGGETLTGQAALDFARTANENYAGYQSDVYAGRRAGTNLAETDTGAAAAAAGAAGEAMVKRGFEAFDQAQNASKSLASIDEAIAALDDGAESGLVYKFIPDVTEASASLNVAMNKMGLDVISSVTFGALSVAEMNLAMQTAVPRDLSPPELRSWLVSKRDAQAKTRDALMKAANYLTTPGNTLQGWLAQQSEAAPTTAAGDGGPVLKYNPATGDFE